MSYNNRDREWDRGKDYWQQEDYPSWNDGPRGNTRGRDDDYHTEGKRRKYNNGVRLFVKPLFAASLKLFPCRVMTVRRPMMTMAADTRSVMTRDTEEGKVTTRRGWFPAKPVPM